MKRFFVSLIAAFALFVAQAAQADLTTNQLIGFGVNAAPPAGGGGLSIAATNTYTTGTATTTHPLNLPASISAGDLLLVFANFNGGPTVTDPAGWTVILGNYVGNVDEPRIYAKIASGSEGSTVTVTLNTSQRASAVSYRITGNRNGVTSSEIALSSVANASSTLTPNPPNLTPSWGSAANLWIAVGFSDSSDLVLSSYPTNYDLGQNAAIVSPANDNANSVLTASRLLTATSEDPGVFTMTAGSEEDWDAFTLAVRPQ